MRFAIKKVITFFGAAILVLGIAHAQSLAFKSIELLNKDKNWVLASKISLELNPTLEQFVKKGLTLYFVADFQLSKSRWYWFDEKIVEHSRVMKITYHALTNQYRVTLDGLSVVAPSLKDALTVVGTIEDWPVIEQAQVVDGQVYQAALRIRLDTNQFAKPLQVNALNSKSLNMQSDWRRFEFVPKKVAP
ncbi:MAG: DUF4390 domain-containing protein [Burkholderiaceae bacterium]|jgi:hypothetical protein|nr:DUF4390 domain-containing protein [Burkholderiaceae bacterium]